jgi:hypothetical protein
MVVTMPARAAYDHSDERNLPQPFHRSYRKTRSFTDSAECMKIGYWFLAAVVLGACNASTWAAHSSGEQRSSPVVIELFQSQGCSSCPPAQEYLNRLANRPEVLALSFSVTYWDDLGWKDSFASPQFTQRQYDYAARNGGAGVATPQFWINGRHTVLGANPARVEQLISQAPAREGPMLALMENTLKVDAGIAPADGADIWIVRYDPRTIQVAVGAGENRGRTLPHRQIVRELMRVGRWNGASVTIALPRFAADGLEAAVLVQSRAAGPILAAMKL